MGQNWDIGKRDASELAFFIRHACEVPPQIVGMGRDLQKTWSEFDDLTAEEMYFGMSVTEQARRFCDGTKMSFASGFLTQRFQLLAALAGLGVA